MKMSKIIKNEFGMTLIELLTALTIMSIIVVAITGLMTQQLKSFDTTQGQVEVQENLRGVLDSIVSDIRVSSGASIQICQDNSNGDYLGTSQNYTDKGNSPIISGNQLKVNDKLYRLHTTTENITKVYSAIPDTKPLNSTIKLSNNAPLTSPELNISQLNFQGVTDGSISITITGVSVKSNSLSYQLKTKVKPRID